MSYLTIGWGILIGYIVFKVGHAQGQVYCMKRNGIKIVNLYATKEQLKFGFDQADCHILTKNPREGDITVKVIYEEQK